MPRTDNALNQFLTDHFRKPKLELLPDPSDLFAEALAFLQERNEFFKRVYGIPPEDLVRTKTPLPQATWRKLYGG